MRTKTRTGYFFYYYFFLLLWGYLYHTISIRDLKIELFKVIFHRGQLPCSGLNQRTKENVIAKGRLFKVYHSNSKGCQNFGWENWCNIRWRKRIPLYNFRRVSYRFCGKNENARPNTVHLNNQILPLICFIIIIIIIIIIIDTDEIPGFFLLLKN